MCETAMIYKVPRQRCNFSLRPKNCQLVKKLPFFHGSSKETNILDQCKILHLKQTCENVLDRISERGQAAKLRCASQQLLKCSAAIVSSLRKRRPNQTARKGGRWRDQEERGRCRFQSSAVSIVHFSQTPRASFRDSLTEKPMLLIIRSNSSNTCVYIPILKTKTLCISHSHHDFCLAGVRCQLPIMNPWPTIACCI